MGCTSYKNIFHDLAKSLLEVTKKGKIARSKEKRETHTDRPRQRDGERYRERERDRQTDHAEFETDLID